MLSCILSQLTAFSHLTHKNFIVTNIVMVQIIAQYNILFDQEIFFSQYPGQFLKDLNQSIQDALQQMNNTQSPDYIQQQLNQAGQVYLSLDTIPQTKIIIGSLLNQTLSVYHQLIEQEQYFNQRSLSVIEFGLVLSDTSSFYAFNIHFYNTSFTGFNSEQFQNIKNFANKNGTIINKCQYSIKVEILCLIYIHNKQQLVFSKNINKTGSSSYYMVVIVDLFFLSNIESDFINQLLTLINDMLLNLGTQYLIAFVICILLQIVFIYQLNRPLDDLQSIAKSHINNYQYTFQRIATVHQTWNQTIKLAEAFFKLLNYNYTKRNHQQKFFEKTQNLNNKRDLFQVDNHIRL
ncbi:hypothetical protein pb186bvf_004916 [Paramecium bursaria]